MLIKRHCDCDRDPRVAHKNIPNVAVLEKTHVVSLGRTALAAGWGTFYSLVTCHANDQNGYTDLLKTSLLCECRRLYTGNDFVFIKTVLRHTTQKRQNKVFTTEHFRLHSCWRMGIVFSRS